MSATPSITMHPVTSSQIAAIGHAPELNVLAIQFPPKKSTGVADTYHYQGVSAELFAEFRAAESVGSFFIQRIKKFPDVFPFAKVAAPAGAVGAVVIGTSPEMGAPAAPTAAPRNYDNRDLLARLINGRAYGKELDEVEEQLAKDAGLLVIFGASDDLMELRGVVHDEFSCYGGGIALTDAKGVLPYREDIEDDETLKDYWARAPHARAIDALFCKAGDYVWTYRTEVPHATFDIVSDGGPYCRGIVIDVADLGGAA